MVSLAYQSFIRVFKKVTSYSLSCTDTIKGTQNFDLRILLYPSGCRVPNRVHKVLLLTSSSLAALFTSKHEMKVFRIVMFFLL